jgi:hypothetical protein
MVRIVELLAIEYVETQSRFVQDQQLCIDGQHQSEVQLSDHALGQFPQFAGAVDRGFGEKTFCLSAIKSRMHTGDVIERLANF